MKLSETASTVINLATAVREYWNAELPRRHRHYPVISQGEDSGPPPPQEAELQSFLEKLQDEEIYELVLLMYLGRGDFGTDNLAIRYGMIKDRFRQRDRAIAQLAGKAPLADYLTDGMADLKEKGIAIDELSFAPVETRN